MDDGVAKTKEEVWTTEDSENLYRVKLWGESYFAVNDEGHLSVRPILGDPISIDIYKVVQDLKQQRIEFPLLDPFSGSSPIARHRAEQCVPEKPSRNRATRTRMSACIRSK